MTYKMMPLVILLLVFTLVACQQNQFEGNIDSTIANFEYTDQNNEKYSSDQLKDTWTIAYFFYTNCTMICPRTTANMVNVQETLAAEGFKPPIIGFSVDPDYDTPEVLQEYASSYGANLDQMHFLTGYDFSSIKKLANESFKTALDGGGPDDHAYAHSTFFYLIDPDGNLVKRYDGLASGDLDILMEDIKIVMK